MYSAAILCAVPLQQAISWVEEGHTLAHDACFDIPCHCMTVSGQDNIYPISLIMFFLASLRQLTGDIGVNALRVA